MKSIIKSIRLSKEQWEIIRNEMKERELNFSEYVLFCALKVKKQRKQNALNRDFIAELARIGNNFNQIAKHLNTNKTGLDRVGLEMLKHIEQHLNELRLKHDC